MQDALAIISKDSNLNITNYQTPALMQVLLSEDVDQRTKNFALVALFGQNELEKSLYADALIATQKNNETLKQQVKTLEESSKTLKTRVNQTQQQADLYKKNVENILASFQQKMSTEHQARVSIERELAAFKAKEEEATRKAQVEVELKKKEQLEYHSAQKAKAILEQKNKDEKAAFRANINQNAELKKLEDWGNNRSLYTPKSVNKNALNLTALGSVAAIVHPIGWCVLAAGVGLKSLNKLTSCFTQEYEDIKEGIKIGQTFEEALAFIELLRELEKSNKPPRDENWD